MLSLVLLVLSHPGANELNYSRIDLGMTRQQVTSIVQQPPVPKVTDADRFSNTFTMASSHIRRAGELWRTGKRKLWVVFDKNGRVTGKMLEDDQPDFIGDALRKAGEAKKPRHQ